jgi:hypothetical protein
VDSKVIYLTPKWEPGIARRGAVLLTSADVQVLRQETLATYPVLWKTAFQGTPRDFRLVRRLEEFRTLDTLLEELGIRKKVHRGRGVTFGKDQEKDASSLLGLPFLPSRVKARFRIDTRQLTTFTRPKVAKRSNRLILDLPALVLQRSLVDDRPAAALLELSPDVTRFVFDQMYYVISFKNVGVEIARALNAILNSSLGLYLAFMKSVSFGWGNRRLIEVSDWLALPMPPLADPEYRSAFKVAWDQLLEVETSLSGIRSSSRNRPLDSWMASEAEGQLEEAVFRMYGLSDQEIALVRDTIKYSIEPYLNRHRTKSWDSTPRASQFALESYGRRVCDQLNEILRYGDQELRATVVDSQESRVQACRFVLTKRTGSAATVEYISGIASDYTDKLRHLLQDKLAEHLYVQRELRVYVDDGFWVIKPSEARFWSQVAALNDADIVLREHMDVGRTASAAA